MNTQHPIFPSSLPEDIYNKGRAEHLRKLHLAKERALINGKPEVYVRIVRTINTYSRNS